MSVQSLTSLFQRKEGSTSRSCPQFTASLPLPSSLRLSEELKRRENKWRFFLFPTSLLPSPFLHVLHLFLLLLLFLLFLQLLSSTAPSMRLDEVLLLVLCSGVASLCVDDGRVGVGGVVRALGLVGQIRSCGRKTDKKRDRK